MSNTGRVFFTQNYIKNRVENNTIFNKNKNIMYTVIKKLLRSVCVAVRDVAPLKRIISQLLHW